MSAPPPSSPRVCFRMRVRGDRVGEYIARHEDVWPEIQSEIARAGRRNYTLFIDPEPASDGTYDVLGYYECDDDGAAQAYLATSAVAARWEAEMTIFFDGLDGRADQHARRLREIMHLPAPALEEGTSE